MAVQADGDGSGLAAIAKQRATLEVVMAGSTDGWRNTEMESVQKAVQNAEGKQRRRSAIKEAVGTGAGRRVASEGL